MVKSNIMLYYKWETPFLSNAFEWKRQKIERNLTELRTSTETKNQKAKRTEKKLFDICVLLTCFSIQQSIFINWHELFCRCRQPSLPLLPSSLFSFCSVSCFFFVRFVCSCVFRKHIQSAKISNVIVLVFLFDHNDDDGNINVATHNTSI